MIYCPVCGESGDSSGVFDINNKIYYIKHLRTHSEASLRECKSVADFVYDPWMFGHGETKANRRVKRMATCALMRQAESQALGHAKEKHNMETSEQRIVNGGSDALCDCGFGLHDHGECKTGARCYTCGVVYLYSAAKVRIDHTTSGTVTYFVCPYCGDNQFALWDNLAQANECYPNGCECQNNGDWCNHCQVLLDEDLAGLRAVGVKLPSPPEIGFDLDDSYIPDCGNCEEDERCEGCPVDCKSA